MGWGFILGLAMDMADASLLGQHALAYVLASYGASSLARRILWFPLGQQALHIFPLLMLVQALQFTARTIAGAEFPGMTYFAGPFVAAALWLPMTYLLLLPQYQPVDRDANRPI
jgi:rod shape-determining protein MreD